MADAKAGCSGHPAKERVRGNGTSGSRTPNVHVRSMLATSVNLIMDNGVQRRYRRLDRPRFRVICAPTYDDKIDPKSLGGKQIGNAIEGGEPNFIEDDLMAFEPNQEATQLMKDTISVEMELNDNLRPTKGTWLRKAQSWRSRYPDYPSGNPSVTIQGVPKSRIQHLASIPPQFTATPEAPTSPLSRFPPIEHAYTSIASQGCVPDSRASASGST
jgi:hypothetical protein